MARRIGAGGPWLQPSQETPTPQGGHFVIPITQVRLTAVEVIRQPNHSSPLFFGRSTATVVPGQPWYLWQSPRQELSREEIAPRSHDGLHVYRTGFQTVGQPWALFFRQPYPAFEPEIIEPVQSELQPYRQTAPVVATAGQPFFIWQAQRYGVEQDLDARPANHDGLHRFRVGYQTVGQTFALLLRSPRVDFDPEWINPRQSDLYPFRQYPPAAAQPGQPWYQWPPIKVTLEPEEFIVRRWHGLELDPFRPHQSATPALTITGTTLEECTLDIIAGATVVLYRTSTNLPVATTISDAFGFYSFSVSDSDFYYARAYKVGSPDEAGTTRNDLQGS